ncbi:MAG TPA: DUF2283 domain-containing protein [Blastocatellia bacterium]|jgi:uncharacterized protein YuzE|nr:DUF2283 domain-containing protein [Blastocatellia bacterium]
MSEPMIKYDEPSDTLYISFARGEAATGIELNEHILLRVNKSERRAIGLTIFDYSVLAQPTELGLRSLPLDGLNELSPELRELALEVLRTPPVQDILSLSAYTPSAIEVIPIASLKPIILTRRAA